MNQAVRKEVTQVMSLELKIRKLEEAKEETDRKIQKWRDQIKIVKQKSDTTIKYYRAMIEYRR
jgi:hypothetical protein